MNTDHYADLLRDWLPRSSTVYTVLKSTSKSGMRREIGVCIVEPEHHSIITPVYAVSQVLDLRIGKHDGLIVHGAGMDMGFSIVYDLAWTLYADPASLRHQWL